MPISKKERREIEREYFERGVPIWKLAERTGLSSNVIRKILEGWI